jgi:hypothetical protein
MLFIACKFPCEADAVLEMVTNRACRDCGGTTRREFLEVGRLALGGLSLAGLLSARARAAAVGQRTKETSVVLLFLTGGPSQIETFEQQALGLLLGKSRGAFDLSGEDPRLVERYDTSRFRAGITRERPSTLGHQLLLARRLCEAGCGFITIHNPGWDMHGGDTQMNMPDGMARLGRPLDHAVSVFLEDVAERGLSDKILLIITGEFGRTPLVKANGGRDHWPRLSTLAFAGGGLRMGQVIGRSTSKAEEPQSDPVTIDHLFATVMHVLLDVPALTAQPDVPRDLASLLVRSRPIAELV